MEEGTETSMSKTVTVSLVPGKTYQQTIAAGNHNVIADVDTASGGDDGGPDPKELALGALGACTAMTLIMVAPKRKWDLKSVSVTVTLTEETDPNDKKIRTAVITEDISVTGTLSAQELADIKATAAKCPVYKLLEGKKRLLTNVIPLP
jgi:putative redox protein